MYNGVVQIGCERVQCMNYVKVLSENLSELKFKFSNAKNVSFRNYKIKFLKILIQYSSDHPYMMEINFKYLANVAKIYAEYLTN